MGAPPPHEPVDDVDEADVAPDALARLGRFHPDIADAVGALAERRGVAVLRRDVLDDTHAVELLVPDAQRDPLRAQLVVAWDAVLSAVEVEVALELRQGGASLPGWFDAPTGVWVDRAGRLQVARADDEELEDDARRTIGPGMAVAGALLLLLAWYVGPGDLRWSAGVAGVLLGVAGLFVPR